jgi:hypothetical protein
MKYDVIFEDGHTLKDMSDAEFYMFFHSYHGLDYAVYDKHGVLQGPFDPKNNFIGKMANMPEREAVNHGTM